MLRDLLSATLCVALVASTAATTAVSAQTLAQIGGPAEPPPASFKGDQFIDSRGCIFMRAGVGGSTDWIPRVGANHKVLCGYPPTFGPRQRVAAVPDAPATVAPAAVAGAAPAPAAKPAPAAAPAPVVVADATPGCPPNAPYGRLETRTDGRDVLKCFSRKSAAEAPQPVAVAARPAAPVAAASAPAAPRPAPVAVASAPAVAAPTVSAAPARSVPARVVSAGGPGPGQVACPASMPVLVRVKLTTGGSALLCTPGQQPVVVAAAPTYPQGSGLAPSISPATGNSTRTTGTAARAAAPATQVASADAMPPLPPGYKRAWKDDRLNPYRGQGTAQGWAQQDTVWTRTVPAQAVVATKPYVPPAAAGTVTVSTRAAKPAPAQTRVTVSTRSAPQAAAPAATGSGASYVQIGSFGVPANATGAAGKLSALGLPVATSKTTRNGKSLQIVLAGPFASTAEAQRALSAVRGAGFSDAFIR